MSRDSLVRLESLGAGVRVDVHVDLGGSIERAVARAGLQTSRGPASLRDRISEQALAAGQVVGGRYELVRLLGRGSMGSVWLAQHQTLGERVALKIMAPAAEAEGVESESTTTARFRFEAQVAARLSRKTRHVVRVTDHGQDGPLSYLVMEWLEGQTLDAVFMRRTPMAAPAVSDLVAQIARGLEVAHAEGVLHRDLKPANVFLVEMPGAEPLIKLLDFGLARGDDAQRKWSPYSTVRGLVFGTPGYMSPEQADGSVAVDSRTDLWSLAAIAFEALTGELPVEGIDTDDMLCNVRTAHVVPVRRYRPDLSTAFERFFERAFARNPADRYATCAELVAAFDAAARPALAVSARQRGAGLGLPSRSLGAPMTALMAARSRRSATGRGFVVGALIGAAVLAIGYAVHRSPHEARAAEIAEAIPSPARGVRVISATNMQPSATEAAALSAAPEPAPTAPSVASAARAHATTEPVVDLGEFKTSF